MESAARPLLSPLRPRLLLLLIFLLTLASHAADNGTPNTTSSTLTATGNNLTGTPPPDSSSPRLSINDNFVVAYNQLRESLPFAWFCSITMRRERNDVRPWTPRDLAAFTGIRIDFGQFNDPTDLSVMAAGESGAMFNKIGDWGKWSEPYFERQARRQTAPAWLPQSLTFPIEQAISAVPAKYAGRVSEVRVMYYLHNSDKRYNDRLVYRFFFNDDKYKAYVDAKTGEYLGGDHWWPFKT